MAPALLAGAVVVENRVATCQLCIMTSAMCVPNIEQRGIRRRLISGWVSFGTAVVLAAMLVAAGSPSWARLLLFLPLWSAGIGLFQAREKT